MKRLSLILTTLCTATSLPVLAQVSGQNTVITVGIVQQTQSINLQSTRGGKGAAVASSGTSQGMPYTVKVSDQTEIQLGDCVTVEQVGNAANIRRQDPVACSAAGKEAVAAIQEELIEDANECAAVKQQIVDATTKDEIEIATATAKILCN